MSRKAITPETQEEDERLNQHITRLLALIPHDPGIYSITNTLNKSIYIGSSKNMHARLTTHIRALSANKHHSYKLQAAFNTHSLGSFTFAVVELCSIEDLLIREQFFMDSIKPKRLLYNVSKTADGSWYAARHLRKRKSASKTKVRIKRKKKT